MHPATKSLFWLVPASLAQLGWSSLQGADPARGLSLSAEGRGALAGPHGLSFLTNRGQWPQGPCFIGRSNQIAVGALPKGLRLQLPEQPGDFSRSVVVALTFEGATGTRLTGVDPLPGLHSFFQGTDPSAWRSDVRAFGSVLFHDLYPGIDLSLREGPEGPEYDLTVKPGADLAQVVVRCDGIEDLLLDESGRLVMETLVGEVRQNPATSWEQSENAVPRPVEVPFRRIDAQRFGFISPERTPSTTLVVDPGLLWSSFLGGAAGGGASIGDATRGIALDVNGHITVVGESEGPGFPMTAGAYQFPDDLLEDVSVTKFRQSDGQLIYSSLIGGYTHLDRAYEVAVDATGRATVVGWTFSENFPTTPGAWDTIKDGINDTAFVLRLRARPKTYEPAGKR